MRTLSEIRREIRALQRKYHRELAIYRMRRVTEQVHHDYARAVADRQDPPKPLEIVRRIADQGFRLDHLDEPDQVPGKGQGSGGHPRTPQHGVEPADLGLGEQVRPPADAGTAGPGTQARPVPALGLLVRHDIAKPHPRPTLKCHCPHRPPAFTGAVRLPV